MTEKVIKNMIKIYEKPLFTFLPSIAPSSMDTDAQTT